MARILVVDDDETTRVMLESTAAAAGHGVALASNGNMAINMYRTTPFDVVIMDIAMPEMNGLRATQNLVSEFPDAKVIVISGANADQLDYGPQFGAVATMMKPINPADLQEVIAKAVSPTPQ